MTWTCPLLALDLRFDYGNTAKQLFQLWKLSMCSQYLRSNSAALNHINFIPNNMSVIKQIRLKVSGFCPSRAILFSGLFVRTWLGWTQTKVHLSIKQGVSVSSADRSTSVGSNIELVHTMSHIHTTFEQRHHCGAKTTDWGGHRALSTVLLSKEIKSHQTNVEITVTC